jgi:hypothetical protein
LGNSGVDPLSWPIGEKISVSEKKHKPNKSQNLKKDTFS